MYHTWHPTVLLSEQCPCTLYPSHHLTYHVGPHALLLSAYSLCHPIRLCQAPKPQDSSKGVEALAPFCCDKVSHCTTRACLDGPDVIDDLGTAGASDQWMTWSRDQWQRHTHHQRNKVFWRAQRPSSMIPYHLHSQTHGHHHHVPHIQ